MSDTLSTQFRNELEASVSKTLLGEARRNELAITNVRCIVLILVTALDYLLHAQPTGLGLPYSFDISNFYLATMWLCVSVVVFAVLRTGWYRTWLRVLLPAMDGSIILSLFVNIFRTAEVPEVVIPAVVNSSIACAILAVSGALRLNRAAPWVTTSLAVVTVATIAFFIGSPLLDTVFACALLVGIGFLGMRMGDVVRRSVESEIGRLILGRFLPEEIVEGAHRAPLATVTEPRRLDATVMVTDLRGFTAFAETLAPEAVLERLNLIQGTLADVVRAYGGRVDKFMGDGMLAVFGDHRQIKNHAHQGITAALALLDTVQSLNRKHNLGIRLGIGVHSGPIVVGCLGSGMRLEFTILGDTVNTASRLESLTKEMGVDLLVSDASRIAASNQSCEEGFSMESLGKVAIRGRRSKLEVFTKHSW